jgi:hypothetical protein
MDEMECICGEKLVGKKGAGELHGQYQEHMKREDHQSSPAQWTEAQKRIELAKERAKAPK